MKSLEPYNKAIVAFVGVVFILLSQKYGNSDVLQYVAAVVTFLGVFHFRNKAVEEVINDVDTAIDQQPAPPTLPTP